MTMTPRILVVDNDDRVGNDLVEMLQPEGMKVEVVCGTRRKLLAAAKAKAREQQPHLVIIDLRLKNEHDPADSSGIELARSLPSAHKIIHSAYLSPDITRKIAEFDGVTWISKGERPERLLEVIRGLTRMDGLGRKPVKMIDCDANELVKALFGPGAQAPPDAVHVVLHRLFPHAHKITLSPLAADDRSSPAPSRRRSVVLKAQVNNLAPVAVKLAPVKQIRKERSHYANVCGHLGDRCIARLDNTAEFWDLGAASYTFFGTSLQTLPLFQEYYQRQQEPERVLKPLKHFFGEVWGALYKKTIRACRSHKTLFERYDNVFHITRHMKTVDACMAAFTLPGLQEPLINPLIWLLEHHEESLIIDARLAITHGDLHGQNLFIDEDHAWTIDFERTGSGHCLRDFIELETDIATRLARFPEEDLLPYFRFTVALAALDEPKAPACLDKVAGLETQKAINVISGIRELAHQATGYGSAQEYLWSLLLNTLFIGTLADEQSSQRCKAFLLAAVLCERLSRWGQPWPPDAWLPALQDHLR